MERFFQTKRKFQPNSSIDASSPATTSSGAFELLNVKY